MSVITVKRLSLEKYIHLFRLLTACDPWVAASLFLKEAVRRFWSIDVNCGLYFDLKEPYKIPEIPIEITLRRFNETDLSVLFYSGGKINAPSAG